MNTNAVAHLTFNELDAIATHAGILISAMARVHDRDILPYFVAELKRIEGVVCTELEYRGHILPVEAIEMWVEPVDPVDTD